MKKMSRTDFGVLFREPIFPVVGIVNDKIVSAFSMETLASILVRFIPSSDEDIVKLVDATGEEFWYSGAQRVLSPGFLGKRWTKRQIIDLYNNQVGSDPRYSARSLSNKRLSEVVAEISDLIRRL
jgi:dTDP-4-dehydrorhamnose reductase